MPIRAESRRIKLNGGITFSTEPHDDEFHGGYREGQPDLQVIRHRHHVAPDSYQRQYPGYYRRENHRADDNEGA